MADEIRILVCPSQQKSITAKQVLIDAGFAAANITVDKTATLEYDAETYGGGGGYELLETRWVVIGRR